MQQRDAILTLEDDALVRQCEVDHYRASGPGGQKRNKTDSAVRLRHQPTGAVGVAEESRSQHENRAKALKRLRRAIALHVRSPVDIDAFSPNEPLAECLTRAGKLEVGMKDHRYWPVAAQVLDLIAACECRISEAARRLGISTSNLSAFITRDVKLKARVNELRAAVGAKPLR